jgi:hypothetical protein
LAVTCRLLLVESTAAERRRPDLTGAALLGAGLASLIAASVQLRQGWSLAVPALAAGGLLLLTGFAVVEGRIAAPMLDPNLLRNRRFLAASMASFANGAGATALASFTPTLVQRGLGRSLLAASLVTLLFAGTSVLVALQVKRLPSRWSSRSLLVTGLLVVGVGQLTQLGLTPQSSLGRLVPGLLLTGVAFGVLNATIGREAVASVPPDRTAMGSGANNTFRYVGSALGISVVAVLATRNSSGAPGLVAGWNSAVLLTASLSVLGAAAIAVIARAGASRTGADTARPAHSEL